MRNKELFDILLNKYNVELCDIYLIYKVFFNIDKTGVTLKANKKLDDDKVNYILQQVEAKVPVPYICERVGFYPDLTILLNRDTLIPRVETEELVYNVITDNFENYQNVVKKRKQYNVLDLCSGSGCMGLAVKSSFPKSHLTMVDISESCLALSKKSAMYNKLGKNIEYVVSNYLDELVKDDNNINKFDLIVCNPPYIPEGTKTDTLYEPSIAFFAGADGLDAFREIFDKLDLVTKKGSQIYFEFDSSTTKNLLELVKQKLDLSKFKYEVKIDMSKKPRFLHLEKVSD